jgi:hypothetical protein
LDTAVTVRRRTGVQGGWNKGIHPARRRRAHAPHCRVIFTVNEMKRLGRDAAELTQRSPRERER